MAATNDAVDGLEGWMYKHHNRDGLFGHKKSKRWFRIVRFNNDGNELTLCYYKSKSSKEPKGWVFLRDVTSFECYENLITLVSRARSLTFEALTKSEYRVWKGGLESYIPIVIEEIQEKSSRTSHLPDVKISAPERTLQKQLSVGRLSTKEDEQPAAEAKSAFFNDRSSDEEESSSAAEEDYDEINEQRNDVVDQFSSEESSDDEHMDPYEREFFRRKSEELTADEISHVNELPELETKEVHDIWDEKTPEEEEQVSSKPRFDPGVQADANWLEESWD